MADTGLLLKPKRRHPEDDDGFRFDKTVNLGNLITLAALMITLLQMYSGIAGRMDRMEVKVDAMWTVFERGIK